MNFPTWSSQQPQPFRANPGGFGQQGSSFAPQGGFNNSGPNQPFNSFSSQPAFSQGQSFGNPGFNSGFNSSQPTWGQPPPLSNQNSTPFQTGNFGAPAFGAQSNPSSALSNPPALQTPPSLFGNSFTGQPNPVPQANPTPFGNTAMSGNQGTSLNSGSFPQASFNQPSFNQPPFSNQPAFSQPSFNQPSFNQPANFSGSQNPGNLGSGLFSNPSFGSNPTVNQPTGGLFNTNSSFQQMSGGLNSMSNMSLKYKPTQLREAEGGQINVLHVCAMTEIGGKSVEEQRLSDYKQRTANPISTPGMPVQPISNFPSIPTPFNSAQPAQNSLFAKPPENKPLFMTGQTGTSLFSNPTQSSLFPQAGTASAPSFNTNPTPSLMSGNSTSSLFSGGSLFSNTTSTNTGSSLFNPVPLASNTSFGNPANATTPSLFAPKPAGNPTGVPAPQFSDNYSTAYRDPHGLSWLFPEIIPESLIKSYKAKYETPISADPGSMVESLVRSKKINNYPQILTEKWKHSQEKKSLKNNSNLDILGSRKTEPFFVNKRTNFLNLKLEEYKDEDGSKYFKMPGSTQKKVEPTFEICVKAHDPNPIKLLIPVTADKTIREVKAEVGKHLPDIEDNCIQLIYKSNILSPADTVRSLGIGNGEELTVINAPLVHNIKTEFPSIEMLPKLPEGYRTIPSYLELARMNIEELKNIERFTVENAFGRIEFEGCTNVVGLDIGKALIIKEREIIGYPDEEEKPPIGKGLNKACEVTLYNFTVKGNRDRAEQKVRLMCQKINSEFRSYNYETKQLVVRLNHF